MDHTFVIMEAVIEGVLVQISSVRVVGANSDFRVRDFIVRYMMGNKEQHRQIQGTGPVVDMLSSDDMIGKVVKAHIRLKGRQYEKGVMLKCFNLDECSKLEVK